MKIFSIFTIGIESAFYHKTIIIMEVNNQEVDMRFEVCREGNVVANGRH
jgi:hypothetical protein